MDDKQRQKELEDFLKANRPKAFSFEQSMLVGLMVMMNHWQKKYKRSLFLYPVFFLLGFVTHYILNLV